MRATVYQWKKNTVKDVVQCPRTFSSGQLRVKPRLALRKEGSGGQRARSVLLDPIARRFSDARNHSGVKTRSQNCSTLGTWLTIIPVEGIGSRERKTSCSSAFPPVPIEGRLNWDRVRASPRGFTLSVRVFREPVWNGVFLLAYQDFRIVSCLRQVVQARGPSRSISQALTSASSVGVMSWPMSYSR